MKISDALIREYAECEDKMNAESGDYRAYWLGKSVGIATALAIVHETDWVTACDALRNAAYHMRRNNAAA